MSQVEKLHEDSLWLLRPWQPVTLSGGGLRSHLGVAQRLQWTLPVGGVRPLQPGSVVEEVGR